MIQQRLAAIFAGLTFRLVLIGVIAALLVNTYADISFKGPLGIGLHFEGWAPKARRLQHTVNGFADSQRIAGERAKAAKLAREQTFRDIAERIDDNADKNLDAAMSAADRFVAANRVRCPAGGSARGGSPAAAEDHRASNPQGAGGAPVVDAVAVSAEDVRICTVNTIKAEAGHDLATSLEASTR